MRIYPERIVVAAEGQVICEHRRIIDRSHDRPGQTVYDLRHYLAVVQRKPGALRNGAPFAELPDAFRTCQHLLREPGELAEPGSPAFETAIPIMSQLLKVETAERGVRLVAYQAVMRLPASPAAMIVFMAHLFLLNIISSLGSLDGSARATSKPRY